MIDGAGSAALMLVFLIGLVLISRLRSVVGVEYRAELNLIAGGIAILATCELLVGLDRNAALTDIPFLSNAIFHQLTVWIGIITGLILIVAGMARWMPVIRKLNTHHPDENDSSLTTRAVKLSQVEHRPNELVKSIFALICHHYQVEQGLALIHSNSDGQFYPMITLGGYSGEFLEQIEKLTEQYGRAGKLKGHSVETLTDSERHIHTFAVYAGAKLIGVYQFWAEGEKLDHSMIRQIRTICGVVGRAVDQSRLTITINHNSFASTLGERVGQINDADTELIKYVSRLSSILTPHFENDYLSLSLLNDSGGVERISVGCNGSVLKENGLDKTAYVDQAEHLFSRTPVRLIADSSGFNVSDYASVLVNSGMRSIMAIKLQRNNRMLGVLLIASHQAMRYSRIDLSMFDSIVEPVGERLLNELHRRMLAENLSFEKRLKGLLERVVSMRAEIDPYQEIANLISDQFQVDLVRISTLDQTGMWLETKAEVCKRRLSRADKSPGTFRLVDLPEHRQTIEDNIVVERDSAIIATESSFWFDSVASSLIIPIRSATGVAGTISLGHADKLTPTIEQIELSAFVLVLINQSIVDRELITGTRSRGLVEKITAERREQALRSSLSGILGSLEMIQHSPQLDESKRKRFLEIIDLSARKLEQNLELTR